MRAVTFDLETRHLSSDLPNGWRDVMDGKAGCSAFVCWSSKEDRPYLFDENTLSEGVSLLEDADVVLGYNSASFDIPVLEALMGRKLALRQHLDLYALIKTALLERCAPLRGFRLGELAERTIGRGKSGESLEAPTLADRGLWASLFSYCLDDTILTRDLFRFAHKHRAVIGLDGELLPLSLPEWFVNADLT